jgi:hypothetical protein
MNTFINFHKILKFSIISRILCILTFLIIAFRKRFKILMLDISLEHFGQEHKFETWFEIFLGNYYFKIILK